MAPTTPPRPAAEQLRDVAYDIYTNPAPVLLMDTCAMLDIVRSPVRAKDVTPVIGAQAIIARVAPARTVWLVATDAVLDEFDRHLDETVEWTKRRIQEAEAASAGLAAVAPLVAPSAPSIVRLQVQAHQFEELLRTVAASLAAASRVIAADDPGCMSSAHWRTVMKRAPSSHGKPEAADCLIIEHYLELVRQLRAGGFAEKVCFVSSNRNDYGTTDAAGAPTRMRAPLPREFAGLGMLFAFDLRTGEQLVR